MNDLIEGIANMDCFQWFIGAYLVVLFLWGTGFFEPNNGSDDE